MNPLARSREPEHGRVGLGKAHVVDLDRIDVDRGRCLACHVLMHDELVLERGGDPVERHRDRVALSPQQIERAQALSVPVKLDAVRLQGMFRCAVDDHTQLGRRGAVQRWQR